MPTKKDGCAKAYDKAMAAIHKQVCMSMPKKGKG